MTHTPTPHPTHSIEVYPTPFVPRLTWKERIRRCGFDFIDPDIWKNIDRFHSIDPERDVMDIELDRFGRKISSNEVELFQAKNCSGVISPARFLHLCQSHRDLQRIHGIVCIQAVCVDGHGMLRVLFARGDARQRFLHLYHYNSNWPEYCRFPCTRKLS